MYKLFKKITTTRLDKELDENKPREQVGFRSKYSTTDHIHAINQRKEKCRDYNSPLCIAFRFLDYEKATNQSNIDIVARTGNRRCVQYMEILKDIHRQLSDSIY